MQVILVDSGHPGFVAERRVEDAEGWQAQEVVQKAARGVVVSFWIAPE